MSVCVLWNFFFFCNLLQNRSLKCSCPWDRHVRRLYLRDDPKSHFKEDWTISFHWISQWRYFFGRFPFCKSLVCCVLCVETCKPLDKEQSDFYHKDLVRVYQKQNLALSWFKPTSTLSSKYECWCEFEKDLWLLPLSTIKRICVGASFLIEWPSPFTRASVFIFCKLMFFQICIDTGTFVVEVLMAFSNVKAWTQWSIVRSKFTSFF